MKQIKVFAILVFQIIVLNVNTLAYTVRNVNHIRFFFLTSHAKIVHLVSMALGLFAKIVIIPARNVKMNQMSVICAQNQHFE